MLNFKLPNGILKSSLAVAARVSLRSSDSFEEKLRLTFETIDYIEKYFKQQLNSFIERRLIDTIIISYD